jgi:hypothetical protein
MIALYRFLARMKVTESPKKLSQEKCFLYSGAFGWKKPKYTAVGC